MTSEQARKLLGGYATNSLTEAERKALFEAALDDQELFDALQQEEALKELLADPASRNQIQQALAEAPVPRLAGPAWWSRAWLWGGVAGAVAASVLMVAVIRSNQQPKYEVARVAPAAPASGEPARPAVAAPAHPKPQNLQPAPPKAMQAARARREPSASTAIGALDNLTIQPQAAPPPPPPAPTPTSAPVSGRLANFKAPPLQYSLVTRDPAAGAYSVSPSGVPPQPGDAFRLNVFPAIAGYVVLYQLDPAGDWKRLFPAGGQGLLVTPNASQTIPDSPIIVSNMEQKFRLTLVPLETKTDAAPFTLDITIGPGKIR